MVVNWSGPPLIPIVEMPELWKYAELMQNLSVALLPNNVILDVVLILFKGIWFLFVLEREVAKFHLNFLFLYSSPLLILEKSHPPFSLNSQNPVLKCPLLPNSHPGLFLFTKVGFILVTNWNGTLTHAQLCSFNQVGNYEQVFCFLFFLFPSTVSYFFLH